MGKKFSWAKLVTKERKSSRKKANKAGSTQPIAPLESSVSKSDNNPLQELEIVASSEYRESYSPPVQVPVTLTNIPTSAFDISHAPKRTLSVGSSAIQSDFERAPVTPEVPILEIAEPPPLETIPDETDGSISPSDQPENESQFVSPWREQDSLATESSDEEGDDEEDETVEGWDDDENDVMAVAPPEQVDHEALDAEGFWTKLDNTTKAAYGGSNEFPNTAKEFSETSVKAEPEAAIPGWEDVEMTPVDLKSRFVAPGSINPETFGPIQTPAATEPTDQASIRKAWEAAKPEWQSDLTEETQFDSMSSIEATNSNLDLDAEEITVPAESFSTETHNVFETPADESQHEEISSSWDDCNAAPSDSTEPASAEWSSDPWLSSLSPEPAEETSDSEFVAHDNSSAEDASAETEPSETFLGPFGHDENPSWLGWSATDSTQYETAPVEEFGSEPSVTESDTSSPESLTPPPTICARADSSEWNEIEGAPADSAVSQSPVDPGEWGFISNPWSSGEFSTDLNEEVQFGAEAATPEVAACPTSEEIEELASTDDVNSATAEDCEVEETEIVLSCPESPSSQDDSSETGDDFESEEFTMTYRESTFSEPTLDSTMELPEDEFEDLSLETNSEWIASSESTWDAPSIASSSESEATEEQTGDEVVEDLVSTETAQTWEPTEQPLVVNASLKNQLSSYDRMVFEAVSDHKLATIQTLNIVLDDVSCGTSSVYETVLSRGFAEERRLLQIIAARAGISTWYLDEQTPDAIAIAKVQQSLCRAHEILPVAIKGDLLSIAVSEPDKMDAIEEIREQTGLRVEPVLADRAKLKHAIEVAFGIAESRNVGSLESKVAEAMEGIADSNVLGTQSRAQLTEADTRPVVGLVNQIIEDGIRMQASDIHIEPRHDAVEVRYRLDGRLMNVRELPVKLLSVLTARIKIMAELDVVEYRNPQDGRFTAEFGPTVVDVRLSVLPNVHGPRIAMRILDKSVGLRKLEELGFEQDNQAIFEEIIHKPYGLFLVTGPTGSGKTTTLYAALNTLRDSASNIMTCEDPVEYDLRGINQSQVNEKVGLTFSKQLRAILRQDPDVILVGEIRDEETAETALRAAMTGHMVLSTLHCNDAPSAIARMLDMGIDPYLLSSSLVGTMSQRLVRKLCPDCKVQRDPTETERTELDTFGVGQDIQIWDACGCDGCYGTGYKGRFAVQEIMPVSDELRELIAARATLDKLKDAASYYGYLPMQDDAIARVIAGETTLEEARRLISFDTFTRAKAPRQPIWRKSA